MPGVEKRSFDSPDETRTPDKTTIDVVRMGDTSAARMTFEPGWRWSECVKPVAGTDSCQHRHLGVVQSGRMRVMHDDGTEVELGPGDAYVIEPGHNAEIIGGEQFVGFEFQPQAAEGYARK
jgi:mannose-6-phosphate isomerase-like protein (cupin superfamily)